MTVVNDLTRGESHEVSQKHSVLRGACFDVVDEAIIIQDADGRVITINDSAARQFSRNKPALSSDDVHIDQLYAPYEFRTSDDEPIAAEEHPSTYARQQRPYSNHEIKVVHRETDNWWIGKFSGLPVVEAEDEREIFVTTIRDITSQKVTEEKIRRSNRRLKLLSDSTAELLLSEDPLTFLDKLYQRLSDELDLEVYFHFRITPEGDKLELAAAQGVSDETAEDLQYLDFGTAVCGLVAQECSRIVAEHVQASSDERTSLIRKLGITAYICHPLVARGRLLGTLSFGTRTSQTFDDDTVELIRTVCDQVAAVIERQQTREALHRSREGLRAMNQSLEEQVLERTRQVRQLSQEVTVAEQQERRRIGQDLHDGVSSQLSGLTLVLGSLIRKAKNDHPEFAEPLEQVKSLIQETGRDVQRIARGLHPARLEETGISEALERLVTDVFPADHIDCTFECDDDLPELPNDIATHIYWIAQEAVANARKYAGASEIDIRLTREDDHLSLAVNDDGDGLPEDHEKADGLGLSTMRNRAQLIGGQLHIDTGPGEGTCIECRVPWNVLE